MKLWLLSSSVLLNSDQVDRSSGAGPSWLGLVQSTSLSWSWSWSWSRSQFRFWFCPVPNTPLKTFSSSQDWQLSVTSLKRRARELRGRRLRRKTLKNQKEMFISGPRFCLKGFELGFSSSTYLRISSKSILFAFSPYFCHEVIPFCSIIISTNMIFTMY